MDNAAPARVDEGSLKLLGASGSSGIAFWTLKTSDPLDTIRDDGYFDSVAALLYPGDKIDVVTVATGRPCGFSLIVVEAIRKPDSVRVGPWMT